MTVNLSLECLDIDAERVAGIMADFILSRIPTRAAKEKLVKAFLGSRKDNYFMKGMDGTGQGLVSGGFASFYTKQRMRLVMTYKYAEERNLMVAGSAHKSEDLVGLYVKFGVDDNADIMPLKRLFRTQILNLARYLGIPDRIAERTPNPDLIPGVTDKYMDVLGLEPEVVDLILYGLEKGMDPAAITEQTGIRFEEVNRIRDLVRLTEHMRNPSMSPEF
jgi:NAD+ synthase